MRGQAVRLASLVTLLALLAGCTGTPPAQDPAGALTVLAPASLTDVLPAIVYRFSTAHSAVRVALNFAPDSQHVAAQTGDLLLVEGAAVLGPLGSGPDRPVVFARDQLVLAVPPGDPGGLSGIAGLARPGLRVAMCAPVQPCGAVAAGVLATAGITVATPILVDDTRAALAEVEQGRADVALVYRTDTTAAAEKVAAVEFPESSAVVASFQAVTLPRAGNPAAARAFIDFLGSQDIASLLSDAGFQSP